MVPRILVLARHSFEWCVVTRIFCRYVQKETMEITINDFETVDIRVGRVINAEEFPEALKPAYKLTIDFGDQIGIKKSSAQVTTHYSVSDLAGRLVLGVVNLPPRQVGPFVSEVLTLGVPDADGNVILIEPSLPLAVIGGKLF